MSFIRDCSQCIRFQKPEQYCGYYSRKVFTTGEAILCPAYSVTGQVNIGPIGSLTGYILLAQIPDDLITGAKLVDNSVNALKIMDGSVTSSKLGLEAVTEGKLGPLSVSTAKIQDSAITADKIAAGAVEEIEIADFSITNAKIALAAAIAESKLSLNYPTADLNTAILLRELASNKDIANGYLGLDAGAKVPLSKLNPLTNTEIAAAAAIVESKLSLVYGTQALHDDIATRLLAATYTAHDHSLADPTQIDHANLLNVLADQHHPQSHTLASHSTKAHSELTDVSADQHHNQAHDIDGADHTGTLSWSKVSKTGSSLADLATRLHSSLQSIGADDHHPQAHTLTSHTTRAHGELTGIGTDDHHPQSHTLTSHSTRAFNELSDVGNITGSYLRYLLMAPSSTYAAYVACPFLGVTPDFDNVGFLSGSEPIQTNIVGAAAVWGYIIPIPLIKGTIPLYTTAACIRFYLSDADSVDYVSAVRLVGLNSGGSRTVIATDSTAYNTTGLKTSTIGSYNLSSYEQVAILLTIAGTTASDVDVNFVEIKVYYYIA